MSQPLLTESPEKVKQRTERREPHPNSARSFQGGSNPILQLQRTLGNQRVAQLIKTKRLTREGRIIGLQPKLTVGAADDQYEQEANRVARQVVNMPESAVMASLQQAPPVEGEANQNLALQSKPLPLAASITPFVQRQMGREEAIEEEKDQEEDKEELLQAEFFNKSAALPLQRQRVTEEEKTEPVQAKLSIQRSISPEDNKDQKLQTAPLAASITSFAQRQTENDEESENNETTLQAKFLSEADSGPLQRQPAIEEEAESIQTKSAGSLSDSFEAGDDVESRLSQSKGSGSQLPDAVRTYMEPRFGVDFSHVRVHTGSDSLQMNQAIGAQAFTNGADIYYGAGSSPSDLELTAHELTHVVQQTGHMPLQTKLSNQISLANSSPSVHRKENASDPISPAISPDEGMEHDEEAVVAQEPLIQRMVGDETPEEEQTVAPKLKSGADVPIKRRADEEEEQRVQPKSVSTPTPHVTPSIAANVNALNHSGSPLPKATRAFFEPRFGAHFSEVRVHTGSHATKTAKSINATRAFTVGNNIAFGEGQFAPGSHEGRRLLAHELTHVVQQNGGQLQRFNPTGSDEPRVLSRGGPGPLPDPSPPKLRGPVELKGQRTFSPPKDIAEEIKGSLGNPVSVAVKFGSLAAGELPVIWNGIWFDSTPPPPNHDGHPMPIDHEGFPVVSGARPVLAINIERSIVTGFVGWRTSAALSKDPEAFFARHPLHQLFGLEGLATDPPDMTGANKLSHGKLIYDRTATFTTGNFEGKAEVSLGDDKYSFNGEIWANEVKGIDKPLPLKKEGTKLFANHTWKFERTLGSAGRLSGDIIGTFAGGKPDVRGTLKYSRAKPNVSGTVTVIVTSFDIAKEKVRDQLGPDAPPVIEPGAPDDNLAITGWGHVDFSFNEWLKGNSDVIVHPEGYVTAKGEIVPTVVIPILKKREPEDKPLFSGEISQPIPYLDAKVAKVTITGSLVINGYTSLGPGTMHDLRVAGLFSTHPGIINTFELSGIISVPAVAGIEAVAKGGIAAEVWRPIIKNWELARVGITIKGNLALQLYAEAAAAAGRRKGDDGQPEYFLKGQLHGGAGLKLDLTMWLSAELAFWSKHIELFNRIYNIAGGSVTIDFDYIIGGRKKKGEDVLKLEAKLGGFNQNKFADAVLRGETGKDKKYKGKEQAGGELDTVPNPDAPTPIQPPDPTKPVPPATPTGVAKTFDKGFKMEGADHTLKLTLSDPPGLTMQTALEPLIKKIDRARKDVTKDTSLGDVERASRLAALNKIEASANGVQAAAARAAKNPAFITPQIPGFDELAMLIGEYGDAYDVTDLGIALEKVVVDPSKPETVLQKFPGLASDVLVKAQVSRIIAAGVEATDIRKIVENVRPVKEDGVVDLLGLLEKMINSGAANWDKVITNLRIGGNKFKGAIFVIRYIDSTLGWDDVGFEVTNDPIDTTGRRWDAWISGTLYQFKSWYSWPGIADRTFLRQILEDYNKTRVGDEMGLLWVFETSLTKTQIVGKMKDALSGVVADLKAGQAPKVDGYTGGIALFIFARVESIVKVVKA